MDRKLILISNDDGIHAKGLEKLIEVVMPFGDVVVVAPGKGESGMSHAITMKHPVRIRKISEEPGLTKYSCSGTPVDSVKLALNKILTRKPDFIFSGINHGSNSSISVIYSGTLGAVTEGCFNGIPSAGFSLLDHDPDADFTLACKYSSKIINNVIKHSLPDGTCLNVNFPVIPADEIRGIKVCRQATGVWKEEYDKRIDPYGSDYYWLTGDFNNFEPDAEDTDEWALKNKYVSVVPIKVDFTSFEALDIIRKWDFS